MNNQYEFWDFFQKVDKIYPNGLVSGLKNNKKLYKEAKYISNFQNKTLKEFFESNGYRYIFRDIKEIRKELKEDLQKHSYNKKIDNLHLDNPTLYFKILRYAHLEEVEIVEYINGLGFKYNEKEEKERIKSIKQDLSTLFPNKKADRLATKDIKLYSRIYKVAKKENKNVNEYIEELGYTII